VSAFVSVAGIDVRTVGGSRLADRLRPDRKGAAPARGRTRHASSPILTFGGHFPPPSSRFTTRRRPCGAERPLGVAPARVYPVRMCTRAAPRTIAEPPSRGELSGSRHRGLIIGGARGGYLSG
jgi:hypothetical protein